jgi:CBS domain containing-hemolysin-like protein
LAIYGFILIPPVAGKYGKFSYPRGQNIHVIEWIYNVTRGLLKVAEPYITLQVGILVVLLLLAGFFSISETALISVNKHRIRKMAMEENRSAKAAKKLIAKPNRMLSTILLGNNLNNILAAAIATNLAVIFFGAKGILIATVIVTAFILIFGEIAPKAYATKHPLKVSLLVSRPIEIMAQVLSPIIKVLTILTKQIIRVVGSGPDTTIPFVTEEEIKLMVEMGEEDGVIEKEARQMIEAVFEFDDMTAREIMVPRIDMDRVSSQDTVAQAVKTILATGHSRTPVFEENVDKIVGLLYTLDLLQCIEDGKKDTLVKDIMREAHYVPESKLLGELLKEMQEKKIQMAIVMGEYGGTAGLVTVEDILEEVVGEIMDVFDEDVRKLKELPDGSFIVDSRVDIDEINEVLDLKIPSTEFDSIGGLVFNRIGHVPVVGDRVHEDGVDLIVERMRERRITKVRVVPIGTGKT